MTDFDPSARRVLEDLRSRYPETPFLALGQTAWWDEPMKAVLRRMLDSMGLGGRMLIGVHDTDYFAKVQTRQAGQSRFELMPHNDGSTQNLWSAAGEISRLFGGECFPTRHDFARHGVPFDRLARSAPQDRLAFLNEMTEAWGWRGLVYTGSRDLIVHHLPLRDMGDSVEEMLRWGFEGTIESIVDNCCREEARRIAERLLQWSRDYRAANPDRMLSDLYQHVLPRLYELLLGEPPRDVAVDCTAHLLRLTPETAALPRFELVDLFLHERTRALAARAYNEAVTGTEMYTLDRFGLGALPFDLVLPKHGRGTLRVTLRAIHVETRQPIRIPLRQPINSVRELAEILYTELGDHVTLVGKAVTLISMLASEFIFVFNEEGSAYVSRTRRMNDRLRAHGLSMDLHPILRVRYHTWDALEESRATLALPDFLAATFGQRALPSGDFAARWRSVVEDEGRLLDDLRAIARPRDLLAFLAGRDDGEWITRRDAYETAKRTLRDLWEKAAVLQAEVRGCYEELARVKREIVETERGKGAHFRATVDWTPDRQAERAAFDARLSALLGERRDLLARIHDRKMRRLAIERGPQAEAARAETERIEREVQMARLRLVRSAILTRTVLVHTNHRPTAWWLPMVDPCGAWFRRVAATTELYTEPLLSGS